MMLFQKITSSQEMWSLFVLTFDHLPYFTASMIFKLSSILLLAVYLPFGLIVAIPLIILCNLIIGYQRYYQCQMIRGANEIMVILFLGSTLMIPFIKIILGSIFLQSQYGLSVLQRYFFLFVSQVKMSPRSKFTAINRIIKFTEKVWHDYIIFLNWIKYLEYFFILIIETGTT